MKAVLITSSVLILVLIALRYLLRGRISLRLQYALWLLAAVRLLVPLSLPGTGFSVLNALSPETEDTTVYVSSHGLSTSSPAPETGTLSDGQEVSIYYDDFGVRHFYPVGETPPADTDYTTVPSEQIFDLNTVLRDLWLCGAAVMAAWFLTVNLSFSARARKGARRLETAESPVPVYVSASVPSPCLLGLVRQRIYVTPACTEDPIRLRHVLSHELTHRRQGDPWWSLVRAVCLCLYWFDPLVWWAAALSRRDCELACDEGAIRRLGEAERIAYGRTLVGLVAAGASPGSLLQTATTMRSGKSGLKERIALIARKPRMLAVTAVCLVTVVAIAAAVTFTGAKADRAGTVELPELGISLTVPEGLTLADYSETLGYGGGYLLSPDAYPDHGDGTPPEWAAGGMAGSFPTAWLTWEGEAITGAAPGWNHTGYDEAEPLTGLAAPAALLYAEHDLYTAAELGELETSGVDLSTLETSAAYWYVFLAEPGDDTGILLSLNAKDFSREDAVDFARSVVFLEANGGALTAEERAAAVRTALTQVPEAYADRVIVEAPEETDGTFRFAYYYGPDYDGDYGGWLFWVYRWDQADFEEHLCDADHSGISCFARDADGYYYAFHCPTDVNFSPENAEDYAAVQEGLLAWAESAVLAVDGMEPFPEETVQALRSQPYQFAGNHITAVYHPYYAVSGDWEPTWTFILAQPVTQGDGGIWCVEQVWFADGEYPDRQVVRPDTDLPMADYYADLQAQADAGQADWALEPMEVCLQYAYSYGGGHLNATAESFELSELYSSAPYSGNEEAAEDLAVVLQNLSGRLIADLNHNSGGTWQADTLSISTSDPSVQALLDTLTGNAYSWVDTHWTWPIATDPWASEEDGDYFLFLHDPDNRWGLSLYLGSPYVQYSEAGGDLVIYQVIPADGGQSAAETVRAWFDEQQDTPVTADVQAGALMDAILSNETVVMELTRADGVGGGRYVTTPGGTPNAEYTTLNFTSPYYFTWSRTEGGLPSSPEPEASLTLSSPDGRYAIQVWSGIDLVRCTDSGETYWLRAESTGYDVLSGSVFQHLRSWYDEAELAALQEDTVIPDTGQDYLAVAQAWADATQNVCLKVTPGSKFALTYVRNVVELDEDAMDSWYQPFMLETEHFYFHYYRIFVPENERSLNWNMAGNTGGYDGSYGEAPEGAFMNQQMGPMYLTSDGWRCDGTGTGP